MSELHEIKALLHRVVEQNATLLHAQSVMAAEIDALKLHLRLPPDQRLMLALMEQFGRESFTARQAIQRGHDMAPALRGAIEAACGRCDGRVLGKRLALIANNPAGDIRLTRISAGRDGAIWQIGSPRVAMMKPAAVMAAN